ncbi:MAG: hypothetical protein IJI14_15815 [Anaerolineaceae bacterium]|nr:hypothetical protein [Anaerolineaceae bacterium]
MPEGIFLYVVNAAGSDSAVKGVLSGLGGLAAEIIYIAMAIIIGVNLFRRGSYYQLLKRSGEEDKTSSQVANVVGTIIYIVIVLLLLPIVKRIF